MIEPKYTQLEQKLIDIANELMAMSISEGLAIGISANMVDATDPFYTLTVMATGKDPKRPAVTIFMNDVRPGFWSKMINDNFKEVE